jgi:hypothetical protein
MTRAAIAGIVIALAAASPASAGEVLPPGSKEPVVDGTVLSDEEAVTRWAHVYVPAKIRSAPKRRAKTIGRLRYQTEDQLPEVYLVMKAAEDSKKNLWIQVRIPGRPNGRKGWVRRDALSDFKIVRTKLVIDRRKLTATLFERGRRIWSSRVGVGKASTPTPAGRFWIRERLKNLGGGGPYGPYAFGTSAYSRLSDWPGGGVVGIHGTNQPGLIPGRPSHGCVRVPNSKVMKLARLMPVGTPVQVKG